jgi:5-methylthioribose kinase
MTGTVDDLSTLALASLRAAGVVGAGRPEVVPLAGGVSNDVVAVRTGDGDFVVKRALPALRVAEVWEASAERSSTEAAALQWAARVRPDAVPPLLAVDPARHLLTVGLAPAGFGNWKQSLLAGEVRPEIGMLLGSLLAQWHIASAADPATLDRFDEQEVFRQLRVAPFYAVSGERNSSVAPVLAGLTARMAATRTVLVHGDFSPKNVLVDSAPATGLWVIDWEVAHTGDPVFDVAFLVHHLVAKTIARPAHRSELIATANGFVDAYRSRAVSALAPIDERYLTAHVGALLLARVDGKSPVDYFTAAQRDTARSLALRILRAAPERLTQLWSLTDGL